MSTLLTWRDEWTLRIDTLDADHREMVALLAQIARRFGVGSHSSGDAREAEQEEEGTSADLFSVLERFTLFARRHFEREEEFMRSIDYPGLPNHCSEHGLLMAELAASVRELRQRKVDRLEAQDLQMLKQWVVAHILGQDRGFAEHYFKICRGEGAQS